MKMKSTSAHAPLAAMGRTLKGLVTIALGTLALNALAAEPPPHDNFMEMKQKVSFMGLEIKNAQDQYLGVVTDLALDVENGRIVEVIVSSGGFLGFGQRTVAVPPEALSFEAIVDEPKRMTLQQSSFCFEGIVGVLRLNMDKKKFKAAPDFTMSKWAEHCQSRRVAEVYRYYGLEPYFAADGQGSKTGNTATEPLGYIQSRNKLMKLPVKNLQNESLGSVFTFLFDRLNNRAIISHVIVLSPEYKWGVRPAREYTWSVIPARALQFNATHDAFCLDISTQDFKNEPRFKLKLCTDPFAPYNPGDKNQFEQEIYSNTKVAANNGVNTRQNVQEGTVNTYTPLAQGASFRDVDKTHRIYTAMQADASLSQNAQNIEVGTLNGRTTLRGHVDTEEGKRIIGEIAAEAGRPENISNLLEVRPLAVK